jgi:hypothetical protein
MLLKTYQLATESVIMMSNAEPVWLAFNGRASRLYQDAGVLATRIGIIATTRAAQSNCLVAMTTMPRIYRPASGNAMTIGSALLV